MARLPSLCRLSLRNLYQPVACKSSQNGLRSLTATKVFRNETENSAPQTNFIQSTFSTNIGVTRGFASKNDDDIGTFLSDEIAAEKGNFKRPEIPPGGFEVKTDGAEVTFTKSSGKEKIVISMNVNHTVDSAEPDDGSEEAPEMKSKPNFEIDLVKTGGKTLSFSCSFAPPPEAHDPQSPSEEAYDDLFVIDEVTMFEGAGAPKRHKKGVVTAGYHDTVRTIIYTGRPMRVKKSPFIMDWQENKQDQIKALTSKGVIPMAQVAQEYEKAGKEMSFQERMEAMPMLMGACAGAIDDIKPAAEIMDEMVETAIHAMRRSLGHVVPANAAARASVIAGHLKQ